MSVSESEAGSGDPRGCFAVRARFVESFGDTTSTRFEEGELGDEGGEKAMWFEVRVRGLRTVAGGVDAAFFSGDELKRGLGVPFECCAATRLDLRGEYGS